MNKHDIALSLSKILASKKEAESAVNKVFEEISSALRAGDKVVITGLGSFNSFITKPKNGHNPKTGEKLIISPMRKVRFKQAKDLFKE
ncbi:MAG: HU family DNA-binding protein [Endomicrobium sp.]|jgi:nucleoid DNA-binding protein|nr:HU family DNA-binding protein [Endomicrobium sp.]